MNRPPPGKDVGRRGATGGQESKALEQGNNDGETLPKDSLVRHRKVGIVIVEEGPAFISDGKLFFRVDPERQRLIRTLRRDLKGYLKVCGIADPERAMFDLEGETDPGFSIPGTLTPGKAWRYLEAKLADREGGEVL